MIVAPCYSKLIRESRKRLGLTQKELSSRSQIARGRISLLERGHRTPTAEELKSLSAILSIPMLSLGAAVPSTPRPTLSKLKNRFVPWKRFRVAKDRDSEVRHRAARRRYPQLLKKLSTGLTLRGDSDWIKVYFREACFDSSLEFLFSIILLDAGAKPGWLSPQHAGFVQAPIINPITRALEGHLPRPALGWEDCLFFPQISVRAPRLTATLDMLLGMHMKGGVRWWDLEIDGAGHNPAGDQHRESELGFPTLRLRENEILNLSCLDRIRDLRENP